MGSRWMSKAAQTRSILPMAALPRVVCFRRVREWNDPALVFWLSRVGREVKKRGDWSSRHGREVTCQRETKRASSRQPVQGERGGVAGGKKEPESGAERNA